MRGNEGTVGVPGACPDKRSAAVVVPGLSRCGEAGSAAGARVEALLAEAAEREREAEAGGLLAGSARSTAEALRREAGRVAGGW